VVVLMNGSALAVQWAQQHAVAILEAWYPGEEGGTAIAETLSGANNPAGRLPVTFYASLDQLPPFEDYSMKDRTYRYFTGQPLYGFGYGLSYSTFTYGHLKVTPGAVKAGDPIQVEVDVGNASPVAGDEVAELYIAKDDSPPAQHPRALKGFERIHLDAGETRHVTFTVSARDLSLVNDDGEHDVFPGSYEAFVGGAQKAQGSNGLWTQFVIAGQAKLGR
jgi:beta-glucosidase